MKVLLVRISSLGDVLHNMPIVMDILNHYPNAEIDWVVEEAYVDLVRLNSAVRHVIPVALRRWRRNLFSAAVRTEISEFKKNLQSEIYDVILDTQGLLKTGVIMGLARGKLKVGLANGTEDSGFEIVSRIFHTRSVPVAKRTHAVLRGRLVAAHALGYADRIYNEPPNFGLSGVPSLPPGEGWGEGKPQEVNNQSSCLTIPSPALTGTISRKGRGELLKPMPDDPQPVWLPSKKYVVFFHATAGSHKKWPTQHWIAVGQHLSRRNYPILLAWGNDQERHEAEQIASSIPSAQVLPKLTMMEAISLAQHASLVIGVDTGLTHIAAAYYRPTIEIYTASPRWKTEGNWSDKIINLGDINVSPDVNEVINAANRLFLDE